MPKLKSRKPMQGRTIDFPADQYSNLLLAAHIEKRTPAQIVRMALAEWLTRWTQRRESDEEQAA